MRAIKFPKLIPHSPLPAIPPERFDVGQLDLVLLGTAGQAGLAQDYLLVDGAGHQFHCAGIGLVAGFKRCDVLLDMGLGCRSECYLELLKAVAEYIVEFIGSKVLEYKRMVKLVDTGFGHLLGNGLIGGI